MDVTPTRFAIAVSAALACLMLGLLAGVSAGGSHAAHVLERRTVTVAARPLQAAARTVTTVAGPVRRSDAAARTVTKTVVRTVTVPVTVAAAPAVPAAPQAGGHHGQGGGDGHGDGQGGDGGGGP